MSYGLCTTRADILVECSTMMGSPIAANPNSSDWDTFGCYETSMQVGNRTHVGV